MINQQPDIDKTYLYAKDPYQAKYQFLINKSESTRLKHFNVSKAFIEYSDDLVDIYKNIGEYSKNKKRKILIVFDDIIADIHCKLNPRVTGLFIIGRKHFSCFYYNLILLYFRLNISHYFIMKIPNKRKLQHTAFNHSSDIDFRDFMNFYKKHTAKPYPFLVIDATLTSDNPLERKNINTDNDNWWQEFRWKSEIWH